VTVLVDEENLSLAIGRRGQNARLTQKLTGWEIDVKKEEEAAVLGFEQKLAKATESLAQTLEIEPAVAEQIVRAGFLSVEGVAEVEAEDLISAIPDLDSGLVAQIHKKARQLQEPPQS
jgi:N utilization substance protein A